MHVYALREKSTGLFRDASCKTFSATADKAKVFSSFEGAEISMGWAIYFNNKSVRYTGLLKIHTLVKKRYEIVEYACLETGSIPLK